ncbi:CGNR zinc finger domain-containing protein [Microbacterium sp. 20-116]|uniref:CGNR zinc finger domain-containing protein n=1 Tax=Microbacterium sp. 20-116 TaxID=3239883 RepID=UPI0034E20254
MDKRHHARDELHRVIALVATRQIGPWPEELRTAEDLERILPGSSAHSDSSDAGLGELQEIRLLRDKVAIVLLDPEASDASSHLNDLVDAFALAPLVAGLGEPLGFRSSRTGLVGRVAERVIGAAVTAFYSGEATHIHECEADGCITPFFDASPRHNRAYCSDRCSTKMRVRRHRRSAVAGA